MLLLAGNCILLIVNYYKTLSSNAILVLKQMYQ